MKVYYLNFLGTHENELSSNVKELKKKLPHLFNPDGGVKPNRLIEDVSNDFYICPICGQTIMMYEDGETDGNYAGFHDGNMVCFDCYDSSTMK